MSQKTAGGKSTREKALSVAMQSQNHNSPPHGKSKTRVSQGESSEGMIDNGVSVILSRLDQLEEAIGDVRVSLHQTAKDLKDKATEDMAEMKDRLTGMTDRLADMMTEARKEQMTERRNLLIARQQLRASNETNRRLEMQMNDMENRMRICNIRLDGKPEDTEENLSQYVTDLIHYLNPTATNPGAVLSVYRIGRAQTTHPAIQQGQRTNIPQRPRTIMIVFQDAQSRNAFYYAKNKLKESDTYNRIYLGDDVTQLTRKLRDEYRSVAALAKHMGADVRIHGDGVIIDGTKYRYSEASLLPAKYSIANAKTREFGGEIYFHSEHSYLSNFAPTPIVQGDTVYPTAEHMYQATKCKVAKDLVGLARVMVAVTPLEAKRAADQIPDTPEWRKQRDGVMELVIREKFNQNPHLTKQLLATGNLILNEATTNSYFGIGATLHSRNIKDKSYSGQNKLGHLLAAKRQELRDTLSQS